MNVTARCTRSGSWWAVQVPEVEGGFTQAKRLDHVPAMVADLVALLTDTRAEDVDVTVVARTEHDALVESVLAARAAAEAAQETFSERLREAVAALVDEDGLTLRDVGSILKLSPQRVSQLTASTRRPAVTTPTSA